MSAPVERRPAGLGRGLASLIPQRAPTTATVEIAIAQITTNPYQPRKRFREEDLESLAASIREHGVIQPVLVTETLGGYQLVAGERRLRAAQLAGLERIPAVVRQLANRSQLELALVENLQRADLDPIEAATAYRQLIDEFGMTQEEIAERLGRARPTISNTLRLLDLPEAIQTAIADGRITEGHARALAALDADRQLQLLETIEARGLSVRQTEELARRLRDLPTTAGSVSSPAARPLGTELERVEEDLRRSLGTKVSLARTRKGGRIVIEYYSDEELGRLYDRLIGGQA
jgi:ParB family chromosome partitioning protein